MADTCNHRVTQGREGERSGRSWCVDCGLQVYDVEHRPCSDCMNYFETVGYSGCRHHLMAVAPNMNVCYKISEGTCWEDTPNG